MVVPDEEVAQNNIFQSWDETFIPTDHAALLAVDVDVGVSQTGHIMLMSDGAFSQEGGRKK